MPTFADIFPEITLCAWICILESMRTVIVRMKESVGYESSCVPAGFAHGMGLLVSDRW